MAIAMLYLRRDRIIEDRTARGLLQLDRFVGVVHTQ